MHTKQRVLVLPRGDHLQKMGEREGISGKFAVSISFLTDHFCSFDCVAVRWRCNHIHSSSQSYLYYYFINTEWAGAWVGQENLMTVQSGQESVFCVVSSNARTVYHPRGLFFYFSQDFHKWAASQKCVSKIGWADNVTKNCSHQCGSKSITRVKGISKLLKFDSP